MNIGDRQLKAANADLSATGFDANEIDRLLADLGAERMAGVEEDPIPEPHQVPGFSDLHLSNRQRRQLRRSTGSARRGARW